MTGEPSVRESPPLSIFDLDRTLTRKPTYTAFMLFAARRLAPWRLFLAPVVVAGMLAYLAGLIDRRRVKEWEQRFLIGAKVPRSAVVPIAEAFADRIASSGTFPAAVQRIAQERAEGRRIVLASAANRFYLDAIAARLGIDDIVATRSRWEDDMLLARIDGDNCYGTAKRDMMTRFLRDHQIKRSKTHVRFFSDHLSDLPSFEWADECLAVNPSKPLRKLAQQRGWAILDW
ncbi:HAD-IB family hydrolase [Croceicoccus sp. F390]|uniref:HAD-IB family hydrolase n=1 Tax=Croceicoccus esteveae TaxID=3075597 RepID=A0ABU2ZFE4_9SPHN|nr:HAD-IB family hydrolase [Croceicoccus sp. F390]MDT0575319.1 HAD-IB family hydrolase [Croceicoccus sp. F390]